MEAVKKSKLEGGGGEDARLQSAFPSIPPAFLELRKKQQIRNLFCSFFSSPFSTNRNSQLVSIHC